MINDIGMLCCMESFHADKMQILGPIRRTLSHVAASGYIFLLTFRSLSDASYSNKCRTKMLLTMSKNFAAFSCSGKALIYKHSLKSAVGQCHPRKASVSLQK